MPCADRRIAEYATAEFRRNEIDLLLNKQVVAVRDLRIAPGHRALVSAAVLDYRRPHALDVIVHASPASRVVAAGGVASLSPGQVGSTDVIVANLSPLPVHIRAGDEVARLVGELDPQIAYARREQLIQIGRRALRL